LTFSETQAKDARKQQKERQQFQEEMFTYLFLVSLTFVEHLVNFIRI